MTAQSMEQAHQAPVPERPQAPQEPAQRPDLRIVEQPQTHLKAPGHKPIPVYEIGRPGWHQQAACFEGGTMAFFPQDPEEERSGFMSEIQRRRIQDVCSSCPVLITCFTESIEHKDEYGYWAGIGPTTRYRILRDLKKGEITLHELVAALSFRGPSGLSDAYRK